MDEQFNERLRRIRKDVTLAEGFDVRIGEDRGQRYYFQITCWRRDVITGEMGTGYGGKAYLSEHATDSELVQTIFGLYKGYWEHEARETFTYRGRRIYGPHIDANALWEVARRVDVRSAKHVEDQPPSEHYPTCTECGQTILAGQVKAGAGFTRHRDCTNPYGKSLGLPSSRADEDEARA